jgi:hypothetical protein
MQGLLCWAGGRGWETMVGRVEEKMGWGPFKIRRYGLEKKSVNNARGQQGWEVGQS